MAPDAQDDTNTTEEDTPVTGSVIANDESGDDTPGTFAKASDPANGTVTMTTDGTYVYTPNPDYYGTDTFTYTITDSDGDTDTAMVTITVNDVLDEQRALVVGKNVDDVPSSTEPHVVPNPNPGVPGFGQIQGGSLNDILVGDIGGKGVEGKSLNLVLILDKSGSMAWAIDGALPNLPGEQSRMQLLKTSLNELIDSLAASGAENVRISMITFSGLWDSASYWKQPGAPSGNNVDAVNIGTFDLVENGVAQSAVITSAKGVVDGMTAGGGTNYEAGLDKAIEWWNNPANPLNISGVINETIFLSDGDPTFWYEGNSSSTTGGPGGNPYANASTIQNALEHITGTHTTRYSYNYGFVPGYGDLGTVTYDPAANYADNVSEVAGLKAVSTVESVGINVSTAALGVMDVIEGAAQDAGVSTNVTDGSQLADTIMSLTPLEMLAAAGNDRLSGNADVDVIFGDMLFTDTLADSTGLGSMDDGSGWSVFDKLETSSGWTRAQTESYILSHHAELSAESILNGSGRTGGNDTIDGGAGADIMYGQEGNDTLIYDQDDTVVDGGSGTDTLLLLVAQTFDASSASGPLNSIEVIDLGAAAISVTNLVVSAVAGILGTTGTLYILGSADDMVSGTGWTAGAAGVSETLNGTSYLFDEYTNGGYQVKIQSTITGESMA